MRRLKKGMGQNLLAKQRLATILSKGERSGTQGKRGQGFVLHTLILRVQRKQRTKNCSFDGAMWGLEKKILSCLNLSTHFFRAFHASSIYKAREGKDISRRKS